jgi:murein DD-endopeptidase MepM/ murein hydrolase activator NlpD
MQVQPFRAAAAALAIFCALLTAGCEIEAANPDQSSEAHSPASQEPSGEPLSLVLPTSNDALLRGDEARFYQRLDQTIPDLRPNGWEGGQYGFVRSPIVTPAGPVFSRIHQGVDIQPLYRDARGAPLDTVRSIADGTVAYVNHDPRASSYGIYVIVQHEWDGAPVYSLLAHLDTVYVNPGVPVAASDPIGRMGYTGSGLARHRAHVHLEVAMMLNEHYLPWHDAFFGTENVHGIFFGRNFVGVNPAALYLTLQEEPELSFLEFVRRQPVGYRFAIPGHRPLDLLRRYPWLAEDAEAASGRAHDGAWIVSFTREGVPVHVERDPQPVAEPDVVFVADDIRAGYLTTSGYLVRQGDHYSMTRAGRAYAALLTTTAGDVPPWF